MVTLFRRWKLSFLFAGLMLPVLPAAADDTEAVVRLGQDSPVGIVRLNSAPIQVVRGQSPELDIPSLPAQAGLELTNCEQEVLAENCQNPNCPQHHCQNADADCRVPLCYRLAAWIHNDIAYKAAWCRGKFGHHGDGHGRNGHRGGHGHNGNHRPEYPLAGKYHIVYPADPSYFDARDGQVYAAAGYGGPVSVPLAPVVNHTYNYGWGVPSSRLTPVLHPASQAPIATMPGMYPAAPISY